MIKKHKVGVPARCYAQADSIENARGEFVSVVEDYIYVSLYERQKMPNFKNFANTVV